MADDQWASSRNVTKTRRQHYCLHWVAQGRCNNAFCDEQRMQHRWMDHVTSWLRPDGRRVLVCQPYNISGYEFADLADVQERWNVDVHITGTGFYGHGTIMVWIESKKDG